MEYEWYADVFFLEEAYRDILIVWLASVLGRKRTTWKRIAVSGMMGGLSGTGFAWLELSGHLIFCRNETELFLYEAGKLLIAGTAMIVLAFPGHFRKEKTPGMRAEWFPAFLRRGKELGILFISAGILQSGLAFLEERWFLTGLKSLIFMGCFCIGIQSLIAAVVRRPPVGTRRYEVRLILKGEERCFTAMADSGNRLVEPLTGKPVSIIAAEDAEMFLEKSDGIFMIPYRAVGTEHGMLPGLVLDQMEIRLEEQTIRIARPIVAFSKEPLFFEKNFNMILPECLTEAMENA